MPVLISNVDDYLGPSQACVNPLFVAPPKPTPSTNKNSGQAKVTSQKGSIQTRRRIRKRRAPRIVQSEESDFPNPNNANGGGPVRPTANGEEEKKNDDAEGRDRTAKIADDAPVTQKIKKKASVSLSDCLSCSGCVTSAESVLLSHHSVDKLREVSSLPRGDRRRRRIVFTISSASAADIYRHLCLEPVGGASDPPGGGGAPSRRELLARIAGFLRSEFDAEVVADGDASQRISLMQSASEFCYRYRKNESSDGEDGREEPVAVLPSIALSSTKTRYINKQPNGDAPVDDDVLMEVTTLTHPPGHLIEGDVEEDAHSGSPPKMTVPTQSTSLPMLSSSCPGFVCLVEKTAPAAVPLLSSAKSPMAVAGTLLKTGRYDGHDAPGRDGPPDGDEAPCYHVAIMPCHDKKLEAGRADLSWERRALLRYGGAPGSSGAGVADGPTTGASIEGADDADADDLVNEVDLVLTTGELLEILGEAAAKMRGAEVTAPAARPPDASEKDDGSAVLAIRHFLEMSDLAHGAREPTTAEDDGRIDRKAIMEYNTDPELDTGVHGSGSYADFIFRHAARELFGCELPRDEPLPWRSPSSARAAPGAGTPGGVIRRRRKRGETTDLREVALYEHGDGTYSCRGGADGVGPRPAMRFATAYGFKNVQLILQGLSSSDSGGYDYVEVMACPSGCSNGGGQVGANGGRETPRETRGRVRRTVSAAPVLRPPVRDARDPADGDRRGEGFGESSRRRFHTRFHVVPKLELSTGATAGVAVSDTNW